MKTGALLILVALLQWAIIKLTVWLNILKHKLKMPVIYEDTTIIQFGMYKGSRIIDIPDNWLKWFWGENKKVYKSDPLDLDSSTLGLMQYIENNLNVE